MNIIANLSKSALLMMVCGGLWGCAESNPPATPPPVNVTANRPPTADPATDPTNTAVNARDRDPAAKTPINQNEYQSDVDLTAAIRRRVVDTKMSTNAHNVKIITQDGNVTLRGPVDTEDEKKAIEDIATSIAGASKVDSQIEVTTK